MSEGSLQRLEELLAGALELPPEERAGYLDEACGAASDLRREVEELLRLSDDAGEYFDGLTSAIAVAAPLELESAARPALQVGAYRALEAIGHGGMGVVFRSERVDGEFDQEVALKLLHRDMDTPQARARFLAERQLLARLSHPNIAALLDGGVTEEGRPYFVMELVEGVPITRYCRDMKLPLEKVLGLVVEVVDAVSYLHRNLVVHRDLKPSNILVDRDGRVKLLDFGIAKVMADDPGEPGVTGTGERLMTPEYAAPEQLLGGPVTTATDVYALGVVLYELLTGTRPRRPTGAAPQAATRELPPAPSSALRRRRRAPAETGGGSTTGVGWRRIAGDLDTICLTALRPEPEARYPSAEQLGEDVERFLGGLPVRARTSTPGYRVGKFVQRHRFGAAAAAGLLVLVAAGFARERVLRSEAERLRAEAQQEAAKAVAVSDFLTELLSSANPMKAQGREVTVAEVLDQAAGRIAGRAELAAQPQVEAAVRSTIGASYVALGRYLEAREHLERAVELRGGVDSPDPAAVTAAADLGGLYLRLGLYGEAEAILRRVLEARVATLGEEDPASLRALNQLADLYWFQGRHDEVEAIDRRTLEIRRRVLGEDHPDTLKSLNGLAATLFGGGRYAEASVLFDQALASARRTLGDSHPHTLALGNNLAAAYLELAEYAKAESLLRQVVDGRVRVLGEAHGDTAMSVHNLGVTLAQQARYDEAEELLRRAIATRERLPGDPRNLWFSRSYLADVLRDAGRAAEAERLYRLTLGEQRRLLPADDGDALKTAQGLAELELRRGRLAAAEALLTEILEPQRRARGEAHPDVLGSLTTLAAIRNRQGRFAEALEISGGAVATGGRALGADHPVVLAAAAEQARAFAGLGQRAAARELAARVLAGRARMLGDAHPATAAAQDLLRDIDAA